MSTWVTGRPPSSPEKKGSIEVGKLADLAILTADFPTVPEDQIMNIKSHMTVVGGRVVYEAQPAR